MKTKTSLAPSWLSDLSQDDSRPNFSSQRGEDRILAEVFARIGEGNKWCVEFGAADGKRGSNTWRLINELGWSSVQIEPKHDADLMLKQKRDTYEALLERYGQNDAVHCLDAVVGHTPKDNLDTILRTTAIPHEFDLLSIDIDGEDYRVWQAVSQYRPRVVVIEHNKTVPIEVDFASSEGSSLRALARLGKEKGYELVAATIVNGVFVSREYFDLFSISNNDPSEIWPEHENYRKYLWQLYDGTVVIKGAPKLSWVRGVDGTLPGQIKARKYIWLDQNKRTYFTAQKDVGGVAKSLLSGRVRHILYRLLDKI